MAGVDTVRGINFQHGHAILYALQMLADPALAAIRVEGIADVVDIEFFANRSAAGDTEQPVHRDNETNLRLTGAAQIKSRTSPYTWSRHELLDILSRWAALGVEDRTVFEFVTDAPLGPSGAQVNSALESAHQGDLQPLASLLDLNEADARCAMTSRAWIRSEPGVGIEALLLEAQREVNALLPGGFSPTNLEEAARDAVDRLFRTLATRAGESDPGSRIIYASEVAEIIGGVVGIPAADRWEAVRPEYLSAVQGMAHVPCIAATFHGESSYDSKPQAIDDLLSRSEPLVIFGPTGSGKSTATRSLRRVAGLAGKPVVVAHAEAYVDGRLSALVAQAIGEVVGRDLSWVAGKQALSDPTVRVVIDGVSEIPKVSRLALARETRPHVAAASTAAVVFVGRDAAACSALIPSSVEYLRFSCTSLSQTEREEVARLILFPDRAFAPENAAGFDTDGDQPVGPPEVDPVRQRCRSAIAEAEAALGDAAGNPMLLDMALRSIADGVSFRNRSSLYGATLERIAQRGRAADSATAIAGLGLVFSRLLDERRRYANPLEWERLVSTAADQLAAAGLPAELDVIRDDLVRSGVVSAIVRPIGQSAVRGPIHDSFADYLAGHVIALGLVDFPPSPQDEDEQRVLFAAETAGVPENVLTAVADSVPFMLVGLSKHDRAQFGAATPIWVAELLSRLVPHRGDLAITAWRDGTSTFLQVGRGSSGWVTPDVASSSPIGPRLLLRPNESPATAVVRLWKLMLRASLRPPETWLRPPTPATLQEARSQLEDHAWATRSATVELLDRTLPPSLIPRVASAIGPTGIDAIVYAASEDARRFSQWSVSYTKSSIVRVTTAQSTAEVEHNMLQKGQAAVDGLISTSPTRTAAKKVAGAINELVHQSWLLE